MNGRTIFEKYGVLIAKGSKIISLLPISVRWFFFDLLRNTPGRFGIGMRYVFLRAINENIGFNIFIARNVTFKNIETMKVGDNCSIMENCYIDAIGGVSIGSNVSIAHNSSVVSFEHGYANKDIPIKYNPLIKLPIIIEEDVWIGCGVRILAGSHIAERTVVAAGAVVRGKNEGSSILAGIPATMKKKII